MSGGSRSIASEWAQGELDALERASLLRVLEPLASPQGAEVQIGQTRLLNFSSNDYLGLANHPALRAAAEEAHQRHGLGSGASRLVVGDTLAHRSLEARLAAFERTEAAVLFNSGYAANIGTIATLVGSEDAVFSDALNHASLIDGCRLSRARTIVYPHADVMELERLLASTPARRKLVVTDAVFSMDGDLAPLEDLVEVTERHGAALLVDEAHGTGVLGERGAGLCEVLGLEPRIDVRVGTLGKAIGAFGAYAACSRPLAELFVQRARSLVFSTSLPPSICAAAEAGLELIASTPALRARLWENIHTFDAGLSRLGFSSQAASAIFPVVLGSPERALAASQFLRSQGILVKAIRPPTVPKGTSRLRFALSAAHTHEQLERALTALAEWRAQHDVA